MTDRFTPVADARAHILAACSQVAGTQRVPVRDALGRLAKDFTLFDKRMEKLATHIRQAHDDVQEVAISSRKISGQFVRIERAEADALRSLDTPEDGA